MKVTAILRDIARACMRMRWDEFPEEVRKRTLFALTDALINCVDGRRFETFCGPLYRAAAKADGIHVLLGTSGRGGCRDAVFYNTAAGSVTARNDHHAGADVHPGSVLVPALLAAAEDTRCSGRQLLTALTAGYEIMIRMGLAVRSGRKFPPAASLRTSMLPAPLGVAMAVGLLKGLDEEQLTNAGALACHHICGVEQWRLDGTGEDNYQNAWDAVNAIHCVELARAGVRSTPLNLEGPYGFLQLFGAAEGAEQCFADLGKRYRITEVRGKAAGACARILAPMQLAEQLCGDPSYSLEALDRLVVHMNHKCTTLSWYTNSRITCYSEAINSVPFGIAAVLLEGRMASVGFLPPYDPRLEEVMGKIELVYDEYSRQNLDPDGYLFEAYMTDGQILRYEQKTYEALTEEGLDRLFRQNVSAVLGEDRAARARELIRGLQELPDASVLAEAFLIG